MTGRKLELFAVQMRISAADYVSPRAFVHRVTDLFEKIDTLRVRDRRGDYRYPALAVFPEDVGTFLFIGEHHRLVRSASTLEQALRRIALVRFPRVLWLSARYRTSVYRSLILLTGRKPYELYHRTFSYLARRHQLAVVAGSLLAPVNRYGATGTFRLARGTPGVYNLSVTFDARGEVLHTARKVDVSHGVDGLLDAGPALVEKLQPFEIQGIRVGNALSADIRAEGAMDSGRPARALLIEAGAEILVQPGASTAPWFPEEGDGADAGALANGSTSSECGHNRYTRRLMDLMQANPPVQFGVNVMLNGSFLDRRFQGRSAIIGRSEQGNPKVLREATSHGDTPESEQILYYLATLPSTPRLAAPA